MTEMKRSLVALALLVALSSAVRATDGAWISLAPMSDPRQEVGAAELNGRIYVIGGLPRTNRVQEYDPATHSWRFPAPLPVAVDHTACASLGGKLYVMGGNIDAGNSNLVFEYSPQTDQWTQKTSMPTGRGALAAAVIGSRIYAVGGTSATQQDLEAYDAATNSWSQLAPMPTGRNHLAAASIQGKLYVAGGRPGNLTALEAYDPATNIWSVMAPMPTGRSGHAGASVGNRLYVFGGEGNPNSPTGIFPQVEAYDPASDSWKSLDPMPTPRHGIGAAVRGTRIYIPGGATREGGGSETGIHESFVVQNAKLHLAHFASGQGISTEAIVSNLSEDQSSLVTVDLLDPDGNPLQADMNGSIRDRLTSVVAPLGTLVIRSNTPGPLLRIGSAAVSSETAAGGTLLFSSTIPGFRGSAGVGAVSPSARFLVAVQRDPFSGIDSGLALANPGEAQVTVSLTLRNESGVALASRTVVLPARGHRAAFLTQFFPDPDIVTFSFRGSVTAACSGPVAAVALLFTGSEFATLPVSPYD